MPFATYSELAAYAEANFPTAFRALPDPKTYATVKSSPLGPRVKIGHSPANPGATVWALLWSHHGQISYIHGDKWIPTVDFTLDEPYSQLWDGKAQQNALGHPAVFDAFIRYTIMAAGQPGCLQSSENPLYYHFKPVLQELCRTWPKEANAERNDKTENTETVQCPDIAISSVKLYHLLSEIERLTLQSKASHILLEARNKAYKRERNKINRRAKQFNKEIKRLVEYKLAFLV